MITLSDLMLGILLPITGLAMGLGFPAEFGLKGWIAYSAMIPCAAAGWLTFAYIAAFFDRLLRQQMIRRSRRELAPISTVELATQLPTTLTSNLVLLELATRGEDLSNYLVTMLSLLEHPGIYRRQIAWIAFQPAFPEWAVRMKGYRPQRPVADCHDRVAIVRKQLQTPDTSP
jgi:hypothetical protein